MANSIRIISLNCRGLQDVTKRKDVFNYLRQTQVNICCLQDTHLLEFDTNSIRAQWGYDCYISGNRTDARGVAILFNSNFEYKVQKQNLDKDGNFIILNIEIENRIKITLVNMYGPNRDNPDFYLNMKQIMTEMEEDHVIMCADWNLVQNFDLDCCNYRHKNNVNASKAVEDMKHALNLTDPWRSNNPHARRYTWVRRNPTKKARLDFFLISEELMALTEKVEINPGYRTDHCIIQLELRLTNFTKGKGFWKFNNSLLRDKTYIEKVKKCIETTIEEYAVPIYRREILKDIDPNIIQFTVNDQMLFEMLLLRIRGMTIPYAASKKRKREEQKRLIERQLKLCKELADENQGENVLLNNIIDDLNTQLEEIRAEYMRGLLIRARAKWIEEGEKPSKYFCSLEKRNYVNKNITKLHGQHGKEIIDQTEILQEVRNFYVSLYSSRDDSLTDIALEEVLPDPKIPKLSIQEKEILDKPITLVELAATLKRMKNEKSPGPDGFTAEFLKMFWPDLKYYLFRSFNYGIETGELSITQKQGIISIIPKGNKPREHLKNWRPISLLNVTYKILSGTIASRIRASLNNIIHEDQRGFLQGRFIGDNTRLLYDLMQYVDEHKMPGLLLLVDFEKAFDSISWKFIGKCLTFFNFGTRFINMIKLLYQDAKLCVIQHGIFSEFFNIGRGCRQGDPLSPYLFLLCVEIMGCMIRKEEAIKGIKIGSREYRLFQYADDTGIMLDGSEKSLLSALHLLDQFSKYSGLKPNIDKTSCIWLGSKKHCCDTLCSSRQLNWTKEPFTVLGIQFCVNLRIMSKLNFNDKVKDIKRLIQSWSKRYISVPGKITVVKTIMVSKLTHLFTSLPRPDAKTMKELEILFFNFIWGNKKDRVSRKQLIQDYRLGGLKMVHLESFAKTMKLTWLQRLHLTRAPWVEMYNSVLPGNPELIFSLGTDYTRKMLISTINAFWRDVFEDLICLREVLSLKENRSDIIHSSPWYNNKILIGNKSVFIRQWYNRGIRSIGDLLSEDGTLLTYAEFCERYFTPIPLVFLGLKNSILKTYIWLRTSDADRVASVNFPHCPTYLYCILNNGKRGKTLYNTLVESMFNEQRYMGKWSTELDLHQDAKWWESINNTVRIPLEVRLRWFQYRVVHRIISTNTFLFKIGIVDSPLCTFCKESAETITHLFFECTVTSNLIREVVSWFGEITQETEVLSCTDIILGIPGEGNNLLNLLIILLKYYMYKCRSRSHRPSVEGYKKELITCYKLEHYIAKKNLALERFEKKWKDFYNYFNSVDVNIP